MESGGVNEKSAGQLFHFTSINSVVMTSLFYLNEEGFFKVFYAFLPNDGDRLFLSET